MKRKKIQLVLPVLILSALFLLAPSSKAESVFRGEIKVEESDAIPLEQFPWSIANDDHYRAKSLIAQIYHHEVLQWGILRLRVSQFKECFAGDKQTVEKKPGEENYSISSGEDKEAFELCPVKPVGWIDVRNYTAGGKLSNSDHPDDYIGWAKKSENIEALKAERPISPPSLDPPVHVSLAAIKMSANMESLVVEIKVSHPALAQILSDGSTELTARYNGKLLECDGQKVDFGATAYRPEELIERINAMDFTQYMGCKLSLKLSNYKPSFKKDPFKFLADDNLKTNSSDVQIAPELEVNLSSDSVDVKASGWTAISPSPNPDSSWKKEFKRGAPMPDFDVSDSFALKLADEKGASSADEASSAKVFESMNQLTSEVQDYTSDVEASLSSKSGAAELRVLQESSLRQHEAKIKNILEVIRTHQSKLSWIDQISVSAQIHQMNSVVRESESLLQKSLGSSPRRLNLNISTVAP